MEIRQIKSGNLATLSLSGRFDFNVHRKFKEAYMALLNDAAVQTIEINLAGVDYLDSSALGMLLMLRERVMPANKQISLSNPNKMVMQVLDIANFHKLFTIA
ncbi:MAG: anti-sigma factor antagonist [Gallionellaceae bacterium]|nr:MAG: anti-sigma factor antagonist [Gallionellaceae bacterium]